MDENYTADKGVFNAGAEFQRRERRTSAPLPRRPAIFRLCPRRFGRRRRAGRRRSQRLGADVIMAVSLQSWGLSTGGLVIWIDRMTDWQGDLVIRGMGEELLDRLPDDASSGLKSRLGLTRRNTRP